MSATHGLIDILWLLNCTALVMLMQAGFSCLESGLVRSKNSINVAIKNFVDFCISAALFWAFGIALMFGASMSGIIGTTGFFFSSATEPWLVAYFIFQLVFCGTATTIVSGAVAERMRFTGYLAAAAVLSGLIYPVVGHWAWGFAEGESPSGWLASRGFFDFAGSTVVHSVGGWVALAAILVIGPRIGRFDEGGKPIRPHNVPVATLGVFLLWFGWFGFNGGSTGGVTGELPYIFFATILAGAFGGLAALALAWRVYGQPEAILAMNGSLAGLVGITASANVVTPLAAVMIGAVAGLGSVWITMLLEKYRIDDAVGAVPVHLLGGVWGTLAVALFADSARLGTGLGRMEQFLVQALGVGAAGAWAFGVGYSALWLINRRWPLRVPPGDEQIGLNVSEHGASTEILDLFGEMDHHRQSDDFSTPVTVEPHTEIGQIAAQYNRVLSRFNAETRKLRNATSALDEKTAVLELNQVITAAANEAESVDDAMQIALDRVCAHTGWPIGHVYLLADGDAGKLVSTALWHVHDDQRFAAFQRESEVTTFARGEGLPGRVLASGKPAWIVDVTKDPNFPRARAAERIGFKGAFAFPILVGADVTAVLEFISDEAAEPDEPLLEVMEQIGIQLGRVIERKQAGQKLAESQEHLQALADNLPEFISLKDPDGRFEFVNKRFEEWVAVSREDIVGKTVHDIYPEDQAATFAGKDRAAIKGREVMAEEIDISYPDGKNRTVVSTRFPVLSQTGGVIGLGTINYDVTERKQAEEARARAEARLMDAIENVSEGFSLYDPANRLMLCNSMYKEIYGYSDEDVKPGIEVGRLIEHDIERGIVSADEEGAKTARRRAKNLGKSLETFDLPLTDGRWIQIRDRRTSDGGTVSIHADITERKRAEELQRIILESIPLPMSVVRKSDGIFVYCNEPHAVLVGHRPEDIVGTHAVDAYWDPGDRDRFLELFNEHGRVDDFEVERKDADGNPYWALVSSRPITFQGEESILSAQTVITERKRAEEMMRKAKEDAEALSQSKSDFVAVISHEVRTPMNGVLGMARLLLGTSLKKDQRKFAEAIVTSGDQLLAILNDLLDVSKLEAGKLDLEVIPFRPGRVLEDTVAVMATRSEEKGLSLNTAVDPDIPDSLLGDPNRLRQILLNLLSNAIKFTSEGSVSLALDLIAKDKDKVSLSFSVTDTGEGISLEARDRLFSAYTQESVDVARKFGGTGLGLAICRQLADLMGGEITLESTLGQGSTFRLTAPFGLTLPGEAAAAPAGAPEEEAGRPLKVLLVEDNEINRTVALNMLKKHGHVVTLAINGDEAVKRVRAQDFDAVLMDRHMPVLNGIEATRRIRRMKGPVSKIPIIGVTAAATRQELDACLASGMDACVTKPIDPKELAATISRVTGGTPSGAIIEAAAETGEDVDARSPDQVMDPDRLRTLRSDLGDEAAKGMAADFGRIAPELLETLLQAARDGDEELFHRTAHSLKSSARIIGFDRLAGRCFELEKSCQDGAFEKARMRTDGLGDCLGEAIAALENETWME